MQFFSLAKVFDPYQFAIMGTDLDVYDFSESIKKQILNDWPVYVNMAATLPNPKPEHFDLERWWSTNRTRIPSLYEVASWYLFVPATTVDCERSFSLYKCILSDKRRQLLPETIKKLNFMNFNFAKNCDLYIERQLASSEDLDILDIEEASNMNLSIVPQEEFFEMNEDN